MSRSWIFKHNGTEVRITARWSVTRRHGQPRLPVLRLFEYNSIKVSIEGFPGHIDNAAIHHHALALYLSEKLQAELCALPPRTTVFVERSRANRTLRQKQKIDPQGVEYLYHYVDKDIESRVAGIAHDVTPLGLVDITELCNAALTPWRPVSRRPKNDRYRLP